METKKTTIVPLGIRNNNPLNIIFSKKNNWHGQLSGQKGRFCAFTHAKWGFRAAACLLRSYINKHGRDTIRKIVGAWAPPNENDTRNYAEFVAKHSNVGIDEHLVFSDTMRMLRIMSAMCMMENGAKYDPQTNSTLWSALYEGYIMARENKTDFASIEGAFDAQGIQNFSND